MTDKSKVRLMLKKGTSANAQLGFEADVEITSGDSIENIKQLCDMAVEASQYLIKKNLVNSI